MAGRVSRLNTWARVLLDSAMRGDTVTVNAFLLSYEPVLVGTRGRFVFHDGQGRHFSLARPYAFNFLVEELDYPTAEAVIIRERGSNWILSSSQLFEQEHPYEDS